MRWASAATTAASCSAASDPRNPERRSSVAFETETMLLLREVRKGVARPDADHDHAQSRARLRLRSAGRRCGRLRRRRSERGHDPGRDDHGPGWSRGRPGERRDAAAPHAGQPDPADAEPPGEPSRPGGLDAGPVAGGEEHAPAGAAGREPPRQAQPLEPEGAAAAGPARVRAAEPRRRHHDAAERCRERQPDAGADRPDAARLDHRRPERGTEHPQRRLREHAAVTAKHGHDARPAAPDPHRRDSRRSTPRRSSRKASTSSRRRCARPTRRSPT